MRRFSENIVGVEKQ